MGGARMIAGFITEFRRAAERDGPILLGVALLWLGLLALLAFVGVNGVRAGSYLNNFIIYMATLLFFVVPIGAAWLIAERPDRPIGFLRDRLRERQAMLHLARGLPMLLALIVFLPAFSAMKSAIPLFNDYTWDAAFIAADRWLHGDDPWRLLHPLLGYPLVTFAFSVAYHLWVMLIYAGCIYFCFFVADAQLRARYFIAFFGIWSIIGVGMATALASVGPCFLGPVLGQDHFDPLMAYLHHADSRVPLMTLDVQARLIDWHRLGSHGLGRGISAMPSMHVAMSFLFFLAVRRISRLAGAIAALFVAIIMIGSVHLAYHYAVDGYVAAVVTAAIWLAAAPLARRIAARG